MLAARSATFRVGTKSLVSDVDLTLEPGPFIAIIGPNPIQPWWAANPATSSAVSPGNTSPTITEASAKVSTPAMR